MESTYAHIEGNVVTSVEVIEDSFFNSNPSRYSGLWIKVGEGTNRPYCGIGDIYLPLKDKIIPKQPFPSWALSDTDEWLPPTPKPEGNYYWDEPSLSWIEFTM